MSGAFDCPECSGRGEVKGFACGGNGCEFRALPCTLCGGTGKIDAATLSRRTHGRALGSRRVAAGVTLREMARRAGVKPTTLSGVERGRAEPTAGVLDAYAALVVTK